MARAKTKARKPAGSQEYYDAGFAKDQKKNRSKLPSRGALIEELEKRKIRFSMSSSDDELRRLLRDAPLWVSCSECTGSHTYPDQHVCSAMPRPRDDLGIEPLSDKEVASLLKTESTVGHAT